MANEIFLNNNEKFHVFSKSPITPSMGLAQAVNKSGHTTTTSDVWSQDIPWFFSADDQATALTTGKDAKLNDLVLIGSNVFKRNETAYSDSAAFTDLWESLTLEDGTQLYNSDKKHVLTYHKGVSVTFLTTANNAKQASNYAGRVFKSDGSVIEQFVASTDKVSSGVPSTGYGVAVYKSGSPLSEGEAESNFIANSYAGIIQFNTKVGPSTAYTADVFEYVGEKLNTSITELAKKVDSVTATAGEGVQAVTEAATAAGFSVSTKEITVEGQTDPVTVKALDIDVANVNGQGVVTIGDETKLVTATGAHNVATKAASDAITAATLADGQKIADTADTSKLVTVEDVKTYVSENAKVTLKADTADGKTGITISPNDTESTSFTIGIDQTKIATKKSVDDLSDTVSGVAQTITDIQTSLSTGSIATAIEAAQDAADAAQETANEAKGKAETAVQSVILNGSHLSKDANNYVSLAAIVGVDETVANGIKVTKTTDNKVKVSVTPATYTSSTKTWTNDSYFAKASDVKTAISDAVGAITIPSVTTSTDAQTVGVTASGHEVSVATADYTTPTQGSGWTTETKGYLVTGSTVETFVNDETAKTLEAAKAYSDGLHSTNLVYVVLGDSESLPTASADTVGKIYLVKEGNTANGESNIGAISGSYVEYMTRKVSETEYTWEKIGTTATDLTGYAKSVTINGQTYNVTANTVALGNGFVNKVATSQATSLANQGSVYANIANDGTLTLGVASATETVMGVSKMFTGYLSHTTTTGAEDTAVSVQSAQAMYTNLASLASGKADANNVVNSVNGIKGEVKICVHNGVSTPALSLSDDWEGEGSSVGTSTHANLWGTGVYSAANSSKEIAIVDSFVGLPWKSNNDDSYLQLAALPSDAVTVENNFVMNSAGKVITTIRPERMYKGFSAQNATGLKSFVGDLPNLITAVHGDGNAKRTFYNCTSLELFIGDLSSLTDGNYMFNGCSNLTTFCGDLSSLTNGANMFSGCKLDAESLECIADTLPTVASGNINIGYNCSAADAQAAYDAITGKGWTCTMTYKA